VPFKTSHTIASRFVAEASRRPGEALSTILREVSAAVLGRPIDYTEKALGAVLSPEHFVRVRTTPGGPAPEESLRAIERSRGLLEADRAWGRGAEERLRAGESRLKAAAAAL
jgi:argininosuccinate lyase